MVSLVGDNGVYPYGGLVEREPGNFYGATREGGTSYRTVNDRGYGTIFKVTSSGRLTTLFSFGGNVYEQGGWPGRPLALGADDNFYGVTGAYYKGAAFRITAAGQLTQLALFGISNNSPNPYGVLTKGSDGNFYGTAGRVSEVGTIFRLKPTGAVTTLSVVSSMESLTASGLLEADDGNFYGASYYSGAQELGRVFRITPGGEVTTVFSFDGARGRHLWRVGSGPGWQSVWHYLQWRHLRLGNIFRIVMPGPRLRLSIFEGQVTLSWPSNYVNFRLQCAGDVKMNDWRDIPGPMTESNGRYIVVTNTASERCIFRLFK